MNFEVYNEILQKNTMYSHSYLGIIDFSQIHSEFTLDRMFLDKSDVALQGILSTDFNGKYKLVIFTGIELFFLCPLPILHETKSLTVSITKEEECIFKFERELPIYAWNKMNDFINEICALNREEFKIRYVAALRNMKPILDGKMDIEHCLLDIILYHSVKIFTKVTNMTNENCFVSLIMVVHTTNERNGSWCYNQPRNR